MAIDFSGAQFGMIQNLKTGNPTVDMALCMMIPAFFAWIFTAWEQTLKPKFLELMEYWRNGAGGSEFRRDITYEMRRTSWGSVISGNDERNNILQKAITLFLDQTSIDYQLASCNLTSVKTKKNQYDDSDDEDDDNSKGGAGPLRKYKIIKSSPMGSWITVEEGIEFKQSSDESGEGEEKKINTKKIIFSLRTFEPEGDKKIDAFIKKAWDFYIAELDKSKDNNRYMYNMVSKDIYSSKDAEESSNEDVKKYKRYKLSDHKTFTSLFFPEREILLRVLEDFKNKTGKYNIPGYPHKLGLLLHGPPGTGKTSLIKALAQNTGRSIVNIPLARIKTNQELYDLVYDLRFQVPGEDVPIKLKYQNIIFVMEDIDACSKIVHKRSGGKNQNSKLEVSRTIGNAKTTLMREVSVMESDDDGEEPPIPPPMPDEETPIAGPSRGDGDADEMLMLAAALAHGDDKEKKTGSSSYGRTDKLDLSGLLNVLDGVVDTPNRLLVMTTNHPEKLDPALIRPGRIDKKIFLGYMNGDNACKMLELYFPDEPVTDEHRAGIKEVLDLAGLNLTPAQVEQLCAEHETVDAMVSAMRAKLKPIPIRRGMSREVSRVMSQ